MARIKSLIIDTNLLLLLVIGGIESGRYVKKSKRLNKFSLNDLDYVINMIDESDKVYITPYIATEVSNLIDLDGLVRKQIFEFAKALFSTFEQIDVDIKSDVEGVFLDYGITDNSLLNLVTDYTILTDDQRLAVRLYEKNGNNVALLPPASDR